MKIDRVIVNYRSPNLPLVIMNFDVKGPNGQPLVASAIGIDRENILEWAAEHAPGIEVEFDE